MCWKGTSRSGLHVILNYIWNFEEYSALIGIRTHCFMNNIFLKREIVVWASFWAFQLSHILYCTDIWIETNYVLIAYQSYFNQRLHLTSMFYQDAIPIAIRTAWINKRGEYIWSHDDWNLTDTSSKWKGNFLFSRDIFLAFFKSNNKRNDFFHSNIHLKVFLINCLKFYHVCFGQLFKE